MAQVKNVREPVFGNANRVVRNLFAESGSCFAGRGGFMLVFLALQFGFGLAGCSKPMRTAGGKVALDEEALDEIGPPGAGVSLTNFDVGLYAAELRRQRDEIGRLKREVTFRIPAVLGVRQPGRSGSVSPPIIAGPAVPPFEVFFSELKVNGAVVPPGSRPIR